MNPTLGVTITGEQETAIRNTLATMPKLAVGIGSKERACSIGALNLALSGKLTDTVPDCMSVVIGCWIIKVQDRMPATIRDSAAWRELLVLAAGTGREHEEERVTIVKASSAASDVYAYEDATATAWDIFDPVGCLRMLVAVTDDRALAVKPTARGENE